MPSSETQLYRPRYGAAVMPSRSVSSTKVSGVHLNNKCGGTKPSFKTAKSFPLILKQTASPHCRFSVACAKERQTFCTSSTVISEILNLSRNDGIKKPL